MPSHTWPAPLCQTVPSSPRAGAVTSARYGAGRGPTIRKASTITDDRPDLSISYRWRADDLAAALETDERRGLTTEEARLRLERFGPNELASEQPPPAWRRFLAQFQDVLVILLLIATVLSAALWAIINARSDERSAFNHLFTNGWLWAAVLVSVLLQLLVVYVPFLQRAFGTVTLSSEDWMFCVAIASSVLWLRELSKLAGRLARA